MKKNSNKSYPTRTSHYLSELGTTFKNRFNPFRLHVIKAKKKLWSQSMLYNPKRRLCFLLHLLCFESYHVSSSLLCVLTSARPCEVFSSSHLHPCVVLLTLSPRIQPAIALPSLICVFEFGPFLCHLLCFVSSTLVPCFESSSNLGIRHRPYPASSSLLLLRWTEIWFIFGCFDE